jgi:hypothetical protein
MKLHIHFVYVFVTLSFNKKLHGYNKNKHVDITSSAQDAFCFGMNFIFLLQEPIDYQYFKVSL